MTQQSFLDATEEDLLKIANGCVNQAGSAVSGPSSVKADLTKLRLFLEAQLCLSEVIRKRADQAAQRDRDRENRHFWIEIGLTILIVILIGVELYFSIHYGRLGLSEGRQQAAILQQMNKNTADTALQIQRAADATTATLEILRQDRAERAKKPRLALYLGNTPVDSASIHLKLTGSSHDIASLDLLLKNGGDAPVSPFRLHVLTPEGVWLQNPTNTQAVRQLEPEANGFTVQLPLLPAGQSARVLMQLLVPHGHAPFKIPFTVDAMELQSVAPLGSLTVLPPKP